MKCSGADTARHRVSRRRHRPCCGHPGKRRRRTPVVRISLRPIAVDPAAEFSARHGPGRDFLQIPTSACFTGLGRAHCRYGIARARRIRDRFLSAAPAT